MQVSKRHLITWDESLLTSTLRNTAHSRRPIGAMAGYFAVVGIVDTRWSMVDVVDGRCLAARWFVKTHIESVLACLQSAQSGEPGAEWRRRGAVHVESGDATPQLEPGIG